MANRYFNQFAYSLEKGKTLLFGRVTFGAAGAPTLDAVNSKGIASITRNSAGNYTVVLQDVYVRLLGADATSVLGAGVPVSPFAFVVSETVNSPAGKAIVLQFNAASGASGALVATDPASGEEKRFVFILKNSTAQ